MEKAFSSILGMALGVLTVAGLVPRTPPKHFFGLMNVDTQHSVIRVPLTVALLHVGSSHVNVRRVRSVLAFVGVFYLAMGTAGTVDKSVGGTLPSKLTKFDVVYHFIVGVLALWLGTRSGRMTALD